MARLAALIALILLASNLVFASGETKSHKDLLNGHSERFQERMRAHHQEMRHLNKIHADEVDDWTIHTDVDDSIYWFSRFLKRSQREAPKGWTKNDKGKWVAPKRKKEEL